MIYLQSKEILDSAKHIEMESSLAHPIFQTHPELRPFWLSLMPRQTPVGRLVNFGAEIGHSQLYIKREDLTAPGYGGNKVRNLEFLLGKAKMLGYRRVAMVAPLGSNFVAAAASQSARAGISSEFFHFVPANNIQIQKHAQFTKSTGAHLHINNEHTFLGIVKASLGLGLRFGQSLFTEHKTLMLPMGGSDVIGSLGHVNAALELAKQIERGELPPIDHLVVGAGTCGTIAGLLVGLRIANLKTKVIGVRCVDSLICNEYRIASLANKLAKKVRLNYSFSSDEIVLRDYTSFDKVSGDSGVRYGHALPHAENLIKEMQELENITLDTTYTSKVIHFLKNWIQYSKDLTHSKNILYWHTFSPTAMNFKEPAHAIGGSCHFTAEARIFKNPHRR